MPTNNLSNSLSSHEPFSKLDRWSLAFDGSDEYLDMGDVTTFDGLDNLTIACWVKTPTGASGVHNFLSKGSYNAADSAWSFNIGPGTSNGRIRFSVSNSLYAYRNNCITAYGYTLDSWNHVAVTYSNTDDEIYFYINGTQISPGSGTPTGTYISIPDSSKKLRVANNDGSNWLEGRISDVVIYNSALSSGNIATIYDGGDSYRYDTGVAKANLVGWWRMGDGAENGTGTTIYDASSNSNNGTMTNMEAADFKEDSP